MLDAFKRAETERGKQFPSRLKALLGRAFQQQVAATYGAPTAQYRTGRAAAEDVKTLGAGTFIGGYELGRGLYEAPRSTKRLEKLAKGSWEGVKQSSPGQLAQGDPAGAFKEFQAHPLISTLDYAAVGRGGRSDGRGGDADGDARAGSARRCARRSRRRTTRAR